MSTMLDRRKNKPFYLCTDGRVYKPQPSGKALLRAAGWLLLVFAAGIAALVYWLSGWHL
jgi:hypothetical protein